MDIFCRIQHSYYYLTDKNYRTIVNNTFYFTFYVENQVVSTNGKLVLPSLKKSLYYSTNGKDKIIVSFNFISYYETFDEWLIDLFHRAFKHVEIVVNNEKISDSKSTFIIWQFRNNFIELKQVEKRLRKLNKI